MILCQGSHGDIESITQQVSGLRKRNPVGKINYEKVTVLFDSGAEILIVDTPFACEVGCAINES